MQILYFTFAIKSSYLQNHPRVYISVVFSWDPFCAPRKHSSTSKTFLIVTIAGEGGREWVQLASSI